jgi:hypothetical protein
MAHGLVDSLVRGSIPAVVAVVFVLARRYLRAEPEPKFAATHSLDELDRRFASTQWLVGASMLLIGGAIAWGAHLILVSSNRFIAALDGPSDFVLLPQTAIWWFLPGFAALALPWEITLRMWYWIGNREQAALYSYWSSAKVGFDATRMFRILALVICLPIALFTLLDVPEHATLSGDEIRARGYGLQRALTYRYTDARRMTIIAGFRLRDGRLRRRAGIVLDFSDGRRWSSADIGDFMSSVDPRLVGFLRAKTGLPPQYAEAEVDIAR